MADFIKITLILLVAQACIMTGIGFISGQLLPKTLAAVYSGTGTFLRVMLAAVTLFAVANFLTAHAYGHYNPGWVAPTVIATAVLANITFAVLVLQRGLNWQVGIATLAVMASCAWVSYLLEAPKP